MGQTRKRPNVPVLSSVHGTEHSVQDPEHSVQETEVQIFFATYSALYARYGTFFIQEQRYKEFGTRYKGLESYMIHSVQYAEVQSILCKV